MCAAEPQALGHHRHSNTHNTTSHGNRYTRNSHSTSTSDNLSSSNSGALVLSLRSLIWNVAMQKEKILCP